MMRNLYLLLGSTVNTWYGVEASGQSGCSALGAAGMLPFLPLNNPDLGNSTKVREKQELPAESVSDIFSSTETSIDTSIGAGTFTCPIVGTTGTLCIWISGDVSSGFEARMGICLNCIAEANVIMYIPRDLPLVLHIANLLMVSIVKQQFKIMDQCQHLPVRLGWSNPSRMHRTTAHNHCAMLICLS